jgi:hypothetical protein
MGALCSCRRRRAFPGLGDGGEHVLRDEEFQRGELPMMQMLHTAACASKLHMCVEEGYFVRGDKGKGRLGVLMHHPRDLTIFLFVVINVTDASARGQHFQFKSASPKEVSPEGARDDDLYLLDSLQPHFMEQYWSLKARRLQEVYLEKLKLHRA